MKTRGGHVMPYKVKWGHWRPVGDPYRTKGGYRDLISSPKGSIWHPYRALGNPMGMHSHLCFLIFCEISFCLLLTFSLLTQIQSSWPFSNRERSRHKKTNGIFHESAQKVEKIAKNKVGKELVDTLYILIWHSLCFVNFESI